MNTNKQFANIADQLLSKISELEMAHAAQSNAYLAMARRLAAHGLLDIDPLAQDIEMLGSMDQDAGWQSAHAEIAGGLRLTADLPSLQQQ